MLTKSGMASISFKDALSVVESLKVSGDLRQHTVKMGFLRKDVSGPHFSATFIAAYTAVLFWPGKYEGTFVVEIPLQTSLLRSSTINKSSCIGTNTVTGVMPDALTEVTF